MVGEIILKKNIIIDARMITEELHGIGRYAYEIIKGICRIENFNVKILVNDKSIAEKIFNETKLEYIVIKSKFLSITEIWEIPKVINKMKEFKYLSPSFSASPFIKLKSYITIHDLNHIKLPQYYSKMHLIYYKLAVKPFAKKCEKIFTVSNFAKKEIVEWLNCDFNKVVVTYNGVESKFNKKDNLEKLKFIQKKYNLPEKYILYVGNQKPHKNLETLLKAMKDVDEILVINGQANEQISELINELDINGKIKFIGYIEDKDLPYIYNLAEEFIFPSIYEGFGLPPLEAVCCGSKVIVSDIEVLDEILGDRVWKFKRYDEKDLANKIKEVIKKDNNMNIDIDDLRERFNWNNTIKQTIKFL